jgi:hypothetical protein
MTSALLQRCIRSGAPLLLALLYGCASSPPVEYYALAPVRGTSVAAIAGRPLQVARVHVPPTLDRREMVRQSSAYSLEINDRHRWSAPLDQMIQSSVSEDLLNILPPGRVVLPHEPAPPHTLRLVIDIVRFSPDTGGRVSLEASWSALSESGAGVHSAIVNITVPMASMSYADQVAAMSEAVAQLAGRIARDLG